MVEQRHQREPVGSVAEETARLLEALGGWAENLQAHHDVDHHDADHHDADHHDADKGDAGSRDEAPGDTDDRAGHGAGGQAGRGSDHGTDSARCEHCGVSSRAGEALACRLCPVCQGVALLRTVRPETVERLADAAAALSGALRDLAADRFGQPPPTAQPPPPRGQRVQDIVVDDEDDENEAGEPPSGAPTAAPRTTERTAGPRTTAPRTTASRTRQESTAP